MVGLSEFYTVAERREEEEEEWFCTQ